MSAPFYSQEPAPWQALIDFADPRSTDPAARRLRAAFRAPQRILAAHTPEDVRPLLRHVEELARAGKWCVGYLRYEAASAFDTAFRAHTADGPLAWFGIHDQACPWPDDLPPAAPLPALDWQSSLTRAQFDAHMQTIHQAIADGELYQINFTMQRQARFAGPTVPYFLALQQAQPNGYTAYIDAGDERVLSVSPELFFDWQGDSLLARPMKGTAPRGANAHDDAAQAQRLLTVPKERAENVMIVDLIRNDVSRVAQPFSVRVPRLLHTEALPTVWQMTSDVEARTRARTTLEDVFSALFPCGSITGAPKVRAMQTIHKLEAQPRGVYCGAVGVVQPGGHARFNVPIRTVVLREGVARCGVGSGITSDAQAEAEWQEWQHKLAFLSPRT